MWLIGLPLNSAVFQLHCGFLRLTGWAFVVLLVACLPCSGGATCGGPNLVSNFDVSQLGLEIFVTGTVAEHNVA